MTVRHPAARTLLALAAVFLPARLRRLLFVHLLGHTVDATARIGHSFVDVDRLTMGPGASVGHLNVVRGLERVEMGEGALIGHLNYVNSVRRAKGFFTGIDRDPALVMGAYARIMMMHFVDCCDRVELCDRAVLTGFWSLVMTHTFDRHERRQVTHPVTFGEWTLVATRATVMPGVEIGTHNLVAPCAVLVGSHPESAKMLAGNPARAIKDVDTDTPFYRDRVDVLH